MQLHKKNPSISPLLFPPPTENPSRSCRETGAFPEVKSQGEGKSQGCRAAQGPSPQLCHPWKGKLLFQTKDTHIQPMKPQTLTLPALQ